MGILDGYAFDPDPDAGDAPPGWLGLVLGAPLDAKQAQGWPDQQLAQPAPTVSAPVSVNGVVRSVATGMPIVGGLANRGNAAINATLAPVMNPLFDEANRLKGATWDERYQNSLDEQNALDATFHAAHPTLDTGLQLGGGILGLAGTGATATGAKLLGMTGETLPLAAFNSARSGAAIGLLDAGIRGQDPVTSAVIGGALGLAGPFAFRAATKVGQSVADALRAPSRNVQNLALVGGIDGPFAEPGVVSPRPLSAPLRPISELTGQWHHAISKRVHQALERHPNLGGRYEYRDPRFVTKAVDPAAHSGWFGWPKNLDREIANHIDTNMELTPETFEAYLLGRYQEPDLAARFPHGLRGGGANP